MAKKLNLSAVFETSAKEDIVNNETTKVDDIFFRSIVNCVDLNSTHSKHMEDHQRHSISSTFPWEKSLGSDIAFNSLLHQTQKSRAYSEEETVVNKQINIFSRKENYKEKMNHRGIMINDNSSNSS